MPPAPSEFHAPLAYDAPLGPGQVRAYQAEAGLLVIAVGPPPLGQQLWAMLPISMLLVLISVWLGVIVMSLLPYRGLIPADIDKFLLLPSLLAWGFVFAEFVQPFRHWSREVRLSVGNGVLTVPFPTPRSRPEEIPARLVSGLRVTSRRRRISRTRVDALEISLEHGPRFQVLQGYPRRTLEEVCDLLGPELGLEPKE